MRQKITIRDVAREAGVSVATVSYVINERTDKRISEKTRKKVLQVINLLDYTPNQSAQALATNRSRTIALYLTPDISLLKNAEQLHVLQLFSSFLHKKDYNLVYLSNQDTDKFDSGDAIVCYDVPSEFFHQVGDNNFVPLLALNCRIDDPLFFQINCDYKSLASEADRHFAGKAYTLLLLETPNGKQRDYLSTLFSDIVYIHDFTELTAFSGKNVLVTEHTLASLLPDDAHVFYVPTATEDCFDTLLTCIENAVLRTPIEQHDIVVKPAATCSLP